MALNIIEAVQAQMTPDAVNRIANSTGETPNKTRWAMTTGALAIVTAIVNRGSTPGGAAAIHSTLQSVGGAQPSRGGGGDLASGLLGDRTDQLTDTVARSSGVSRSASSGIMGALLPMIAGLLGREAVSRRLDVNGVSDLLQSQKPYLGTGLGAGVAPTGVQATEIEPKDVGVFQAAQPARAQRPVRPEPHKRNWLPLLLLGLLLLAGFLLLLRWRTPGEQFSKPETPSVEAPLGRGPTVPEEPVGQTTTTGAEMDKPSAEELGAHFEGKGQLPDRFALPGITFDFGAATMTAGGESTIDALADQMREHPTAKVRLEGHTDSAGDPAVNTPLSRERAGVVKKMLIDRGIDESRIESTGKRDANPVAPNDTRAGRAQNRRIDIVILQR